VKVSSHFLIIFILSFTVFLTREQPEVFRHTLKLVTAEQLSARQ
jgi:hypothetical protein